MIDHHRKLIFIHIARTGGSSVEAALVGKDWWYVDSATKHISARQARQLYGEDVWNSYTKFSIVRNPWDRIISIWATTRWHETAGLALNCSLETFIRNLKPHPRERYNSLFYHEILDEEMDFVLRFENLEDDLNRMLTVSGHQPVQLPHVNKKQRGSYQQMHTEQSRALIREMFARDIEAFGYEF